MDRKAFNTLNYGISLVGAAAEGKRNGCVVNSLHQATSSTPYKFTVTMNKSNETTKTILKAGSFAATVLSRECPKELINQFGYKSGRVGDKFTAYEVGTDEAGNPYVKDHALARISCRVVEQLDLGSYLLFVGEVTEAEVLGEGIGLALDDFKTRGCSTPPAATVYRTLEGNEGWKCTICGYVAEKETLPEGYQCPLCRANRDKFVKL